MNEIKVLNTILEGDITTHIYKGECQDSLNEIQKTVCGTLKPHMYKLFKIEGSFHLDNSYLDKK